MSINVNPHQQVVLASNNAGKVREMQSLLAAMGLEVLPQSELAIDSVAETGLSFVENAILKARHACRCSGLPAIADDSGLEVDALHGQPGIYSARYAEEAEGDQDSANNTKLLNRLTGLTQMDRRARYRCLLVFMRHHEDPTPIICQGTWEGRILHQPEGEGGFGYDPIFYVPETDCSAAQLSAEQKNSLSHRGRALQALIQQLQTYYPPVATA
ncbi:MAG: RdgB/HAM1 family non-canonical purine NTP pyrophosphatase [Gammaproteobacteria bacterium]|nr:RdgB/HAM1 family non-canonical purine NTP pyrophosphatase [Gammaproteobacteria bacterium]